MSPSRLLDIAASGAGLLLLSPVFAVVALGVRLTSPGPVFYRALRTGREGRAFYVLKFRSMVVDAALKGPGITPAGDDRITPIGRFLRKTKIDELPQLINVLRGEMSLVGPRPEDPRYVALYNEEQRKVLRTRPGITSPASLLFRNEGALLSGPDWERTYREVVLHQKLGIELEYLEHRTFWTDLVLVLKTVGALAREAGRKS